MSIKNAAFKQIIPAEDGFSVLLRGDAFNDIDSPHYLAHQHLEENLWDQYRDSASKAEWRFPLPTYSEYWDASHESLLYAGFLSPADADRIVKVPLDSKY